MTRAPTVVQVINYLCERTHSRANSTAYSLVQHLSRPLQCCHSDLCQTSRPHPPPSLDTRGLQPAITPPITHSRPFDRALSVAQDPVWGVCPRDIKRAKSSQSAGKCPEAGAVEGSWVRQQKAGQYPACRFAVRRSRTSLRSATSGRLDESAAATSRFRLRRQRFPST